MSKYLEFVRADVESLGRKTDVYYVKSKMHGNLLGRIRWYGPWRQYTFHPTELTIFNPTCLIEIADKVNELTVDHRTRLKETHDSVR